MAVEKRVGTIADWQELTPGLATFRLRPHAGASFPAYKAGQYIALTRENCKLTAKVKDSNPARYEPALDASGAQKIGPVTHSYSIASAPFETLETGALEFYVTLEKDAEGHLGRLTESLFNAGRDHNGDTLGYVDRIVGNFTLDQRAPGFENVVLVGTGTGLAPFVGMAKQLDHEARNGAKPAGRFTLVHANRTKGELAYDAELRAIQARRAFDFAYVPSVSRPAPDDADDRALSQGRANNLIRTILGLPLREEEIARETGVAPARLTRPVVAPDLDAAELRDRMPGGQKTAILTCGNPDLMDDIRRIAEKADFRFEMEEW
jgi:ferredoxin-NADP reductase